MQKQIGRESRPPKVRESLLPVASSALASSTLSESSWAALTKPRLQVAAPFHGFEHSDFVGVFEVRADGNANPDARDPHAQRFQ